jgi:hypothetical protein
MATIFNKISALSERKRRVNSAPYFLDKKAITLIICVEMKEVKTAIFFGES